MCIKIAVKFIFLTFFIFINACNRSQFRTVIEMNWDIKDKNIGDGIILMEGYNSDVPLRAWAVIIPKSNNKIKILVSDDDDGLETPQEMAKKTGAVVVINGGYFSRGQYPISHVGLLKSKNKLIEPASGSVIRDNIRYNINRGALGIMYDNTVDISWASTLNDSIFCWDYPINNRPGNPALVNYDNAQYWSVVEAMHAGPILINKGLQMVTTEEEIFFNTPVDGIQPRSAMGLKKNGDVIFMVVDGRQIDSRGVYLKELAMLMAQFDCDQALNLDGGGSSALIINGKLINKPIGLKTQRQVMSCVGVITEG
tara:strand:- start:4829 stop:5761 length:933 start_codon:yes stop_codon:yes gene_type:complete